MESDAGFTGIGQDRGLRTSCKSETGRQRLGGDAVVFRRAGRQANGQPCQRQSVRCRR